MAWKWLPDGREMYGVEPPAIIVIVLIAGMGALGLGLVRAIRGSGSGGHEK